MLRVVVDWYQPKEEDWEAERCLYAYLHPRTRKPLYIGKADFSSADERWRAHEEDGVFDYFEDELGLEEWDTMVGDVVEVRGSARLSVELLEDVETLLIWSLRPPGNVKVAEPKRPGLWITCKGTWPLRKRTFADPG